MTEFSDARIEKGVLFGSEGDLFLVGGGHEPLRFIKGDVLPPRLCSLIHDNIAQRSALAERHGAGFVQLVAPEKYIVQPGNFPFAAPGHMARAYLDAGYGDLLYPVAELRATKGGSAYQKTDSHWSKYGIITMAAFLAGQAGTPADIIAPKVAELTAGVVETPEVFYGDLGRKFDPMLGEPKTVFTTRFTHKTYDNGLQHDFNSAVNDGRLIYIESPDAVGDLSLLIFGDSYLSNALMPLAVFFRRILFARTRFFHEEIVTGFRPDMIVGQMAERYMASAVPDHQAPPFLMIPHLLGREARMTVDTALAFCRALSGGRDFNPAVFKLKEAAK